MDESLYMRRFFETLPAIFLLVISGIFIVNIANKPTLAICTGAVLFAFVMMPRGRWLMRILIALILVAACHDYWEGLLR